MGSSSTFANPLPVQRGRGEVNGQKCPFFLSICSGRGVGRQVFGQILGYFYPFSAVFRVFCPYLAIFQGIYLYRPTQSPCGKYCRRFAPLKNLQRLRRLINNQFASQTGTLYRSVFVGVGQDQMTPHPPNNITTSIYIQTSTVIQL